MATEIVGKVSLDGSSIGNVRKQLKEATAELIAMQQQFGKTSNEAINAAKRVADLKDQIQEANETAALFDPGNKFAAFTGVLQGVAQGFTAVQGAMGLFGVESEEVEKQLLKVQSAMALSQGLSGVLDAGKHFTGLAAKIKGPVVAAFTSLRGAIIATGFGALAVAVGLLIANFDKVRDTILKMFPGLEKLGKFIGKLVQGFTDFIGVTSNATRALSALEAQQKKNQQAAQNQIKILQAQGGKEKEIYELTKQLKKDELNLLNQTLKTKGKLTEEELKQKNDLLVDLEVLDINETNRINAENQKRAEKNKQHNEKVAAEEKKRYEERMADRKKAEDGVQQMLDNYAKQEEDRAANTALKKLELEKKRDRDRLLSLGASATALMAAEKYWNKLIEEEREKDRQKSLENVIAGGNKTIAALEAQVGKQQAINQRFREQELAADQALQQAKSDVLQAGFQVLGAIVGQNRKLQDALFAVEKAVAIASVITNAQKEIAGYFSTYSAAGPPGLAIAAKLALAAKIRAGASIATIAAQAIGKYINRGGGGGAAAVGGGNVSTAAPLQAGLSPQTQLQVQNQQAINAMGNQATRAYILNSDLQNNNQINAYLQRNATIG